MQSPPAKHIFGVKKVEYSILRVKTEENGSNDSALPDHMDGTFQQPTNVTSLENNDGHGIEDDEGQFSECSQNQLVLYEPATNSATEIEAIPDPSEHQLPPFPGYSIPNQVSRNLPSVGAFAVQCANCFKWRLVPTKEKYEEIREHILEQHFVCETAREWRAEVSCEDPADISQDGSRLWAIDKPSIAQPPPGWQRLLRIRGEGSTKFADVYYVAPSGKRLRSMVEIQRYLLEHPEYMTEGVTMSQFSFQIPRPLQENYVRKRPTRLAACYDGTSPGMPGPRGPSEVDPMPWSGPDESLDLQLGRPRLSAPYFEAPVFDPIFQPPKKRARTSTKRILNANLVYNQQMGKVEEPNQVLSLKPSFL